MPTLLLPSMPLLMLPYSDSPFFCSSVRTKCSLYSHKLLLFHNILVSSELKRLVILHIDACFNLTLDLDFSFVYFILFLVGKERNFFFVLLFSSDSARSISAAPEDEWNRLLIDGMTVGKGEVSLDELYAVIKKRIERTLIRTVSLLFLSSRP